MWAPRAFLSSTHAHVVYRGAARTGTGYALLVESINEVVNIHTKGVSEALTEVISGRADCYFALVFQAKRMVEGGKVAALATGSPKRSGLMPDVPTTLELGYANSDYTVLYGVLTPVARTRGPLPIRITGSNDLTASYGILG